MENMRRLFKKALILMLLSSLELVVSAQTPPEKAIKGIVTDEKGEAIFGANVRVKGTDRGVATGAAGQFALSGVTETSRLEISYIGYFPQEIPVGKKDFFSIILKENDKLLDEVVVVGFGLQKKVNLTGSVTAIGGKQLEQRPIVSASAALQGIAPGVTVTTHTGAPGADNGQIRVRGISSFGGSDCAPLVLIDGVAGDMNLLDVNQIESISVLKDAASASIYGSRAANGVVLITTKRAASGKLTANYRGYVGWQSATRIPKVTDGLTYMNVFNQASMNDNGYEIYSADDIADFTKRYRADPSNFDWQDAILQGSGFTHNHFLSLQAGSGKIRVMPSLAYSDQAGIIRNTGYKRYVVRNNMDIELSEKLKLTFDFSFVNKDRQQVAGESNVWNYFGRMPTNIPIRRNGRWSEGWVKKNPVAIIEEGGNKKTNNIELEGRLALDFRPFDWLQVTGIMAPRYKTQNVHTFTKSIMTYNDDGSEAGAAEPYTDLTETARRYYWENYQAYASAEKTWGDHSFRLMAGGSRETYDTKYLMGYRRNYTYDTYEVLKAGADDETKDNDGTHEQWCLVSAFGRFNYDYKQRYLFEANIRYDGSSRFAPGNRWAAFPSFSGAWRISEEPFMKKARRYVDNLKLRASWGKLGNQNIGSSFYPFADMLAVGSASMGGVLYPIVTQNTLSNRELRWEETTLTDLGIDLNLFNHFTLTFDWYKKKTDGILMQLSVSKLIGLGAPFQNAGKVENKGWDLSVGYDNRWGDFDFGLQLTLSDVKNKIVDMKGQTSGTLLRQQKGSPINSIYGYIAEGLYRNQDEIDNGPEQFGTLHPGDIRYKDIAGAFDENGKPVPDGKITEADKVVIGSTIPRYTYGVNLNLGYKGIRLNAFFQGVGKADGYLDSHYVIPCVNSSAVKEWQLDYWTEANPGAAFPRLSTTSTNNTQHSTWWMKSAAYMRLKNIQVGYTLPKRWSEKMGLKECFVYVNGQNLFTLTGFWKGYDPEVNYNAGAADGVALGEADTYPQVKMYSIGIDVKF